MKQNTDTYRAVKDSFWTDILVLDLSPEEKLFYLWLFTNEHLDPCGCYQATIRTIEYETGLGRDAIAVLIQRFVALERIKYNEQNKEFILLKWKKNNQGFFKASNVNSIKGIRQGAAKINTPEFRQIVAEWLGDKEAPTLPPTPEATPQPLTINPEPITLNQETTATVSKVATELASAPETGEESSSMGLFEFRDGFQKATGKTLKGGANEDAMAACRAYSKEAIAEAFRVTALQGGETLKYVLTVLKGEPRAIGPRGRDSPTRKGQERDRILAANAAACREFGEEGDRAQGAG